MEAPDLIRIAVLVAGCVAMAIDARRIRTGRAMRITSRYLATLSVASIGLLVFLWFNHAGFPLHLDVMEGTVVQHARRAAALEPVYPAPSAEYVPFCYNPLFYVLAAPFFWVFGEGVLVLRLLSIAASAGIGFVLYRWLASGTGGRWWGLVGVGLYAAAYRAMDAYLDTAHADSWMILCALFGSYVLARSRSRAQNLTGVICLVAAFWFKQQGAFFVVGGIAYLTWKEGVWRSWPYWLAAAAAGPVLYFLAGPLLFGPEFLTFTFEYPRQFVEATPRAILRFGYHVVRYYPVLVCAGGIAALLAVARGRKAADVVHVQLMFGLASGGADALNPGSSDNVFAVMGVFLVLAGVFALHRWSSASSTRVRALCQAGLVISFAVLVFDPRKVVVGRAAQVQFAELVQELRALDGPVHAPSIGWHRQVLQPTAHWCALYDVARGGDPGEVERIMKPLARAPAPSYLLTNEPLERFWWLSFLARDYVLDRDLGDRFWDLQGLPTRFGRHGWPRYLYRHR